MVMSFQIKNLTSSTLHAEKINVHIFINLKI
jgi:hypothetical protein